MASSFPLSWDFVERQPRTQLPGSLFPAEHRSLLRIRPLWVEHDARPATASHPPPAPSLVPRYGTYNRQNMVAPRLPWPRHDCCARVPGACLLWLIRCPRARVALMPPAHRVHCWTKTVASADPRSPTGGDANAAADSAADHLDLGPVWCVDGGSRRCVNQNTHAHPSAGRSGFTLHVW